MQVFMIGALQRQADKLVKLAREAKFSPEDREEMATAITKMNDALSNLHSAKQDSQ